MKENIYELIYLYFLKDEEAFQKLIEYFRPTVHYIIQQKGYTYQKSSQIVQDYFHLADILLHECLLRCQSHRYQSFKAFYKQSLINKIIDYNRTHYSSQIETHYPTIHLDQYVREDIEQYTYNGLEDHKTNVHRHILLKIDMERKHQLLAQDLKEVEIQIYNLYIEGYSTSDISRKLDMPIRNVRYVINKIKKWLMAH